MVTDTGMVTTRQKSAAVSLCIVSNQLNATLEKLIDVAYGRVAEILVGYDSIPLELPATFNTQGKAVMIPMRWQGYSETKNNLAAKASQDWILSLDGDEVPDMEMLQHICALPFHKLPIHDIYALRRISFFEGKKIMHGAWGKDRVLRLYHKGYTRWDGEIVHEDLQKKDDSTIRTLNGILWHYTADTYDVFLAKNKKYALLSAEKYYARGKKSPGWKKIFSPVFTFIKEYVFQGGFMDGSAGMKIAWVNTRYTYWKYHYLKQKYQRSS